MEISIRKSFLVSLGIHLSIFLIIGIAALFRPVTVTEITTLVTVDTEVTSVSPGEELPVSRKKETVSVKNREPAVKQRPVRQKNTQKLLASMKNGKNTAADDDGLAKRKEQEAQRLSNEQVLAANREMEKVSGDVDKALSENADSSAARNTTVKSGSGGTDPLGDAGWSKRPRKTVYFPNIQSKIPARYKMKGMSYAITAKIAFDSNGLATRVEIVASSGDANIDNIFFSELKKVRVEPIPENRIDVITKRFSISLK